MVPVSLVELGDHRDVPARLAGPVPPLQPGLPVLLPGENAIHPGNPAAPPVAGLGRSGLRMLRHSGFVVLLYSNDRLCRFWFQDLRRLALFLALMRESRWLRDGELGHFSLTALARQSQMSSARTSQLLGICAATGDFTRCQDPRDARYLVFEPSLDTRAGLARLVAEGCEAAAQVLGRPNPLPLLGEDGLHQVYRAFIDHVLAGLDGAELDDRGTGSLTFFMALADLALYSPIVAADFVRREADRLQVTTVTLRNVLRRAEQGGWIRRMARMLFMPAEVQRQADPLVQAVLRCCSAILDEADQALATQTRTAPEDIRHLSRA